QRDYEADSKRSAGDHRLSNHQVAQLRAAAAAATKRLGRNHGRVTSHAFDGTWKQLGPNPIVGVARSDNAFTALSGRIGPLAIRPGTHQFSRGGARGGLWLYAPASGRWTPTADDEASLAIGALAIAPTDDSIVYAGTGEGALSGDSQFGNGILRS